MDRRKDADGKCSYRIRWRGFGPKHDTWEPEENLHCADLLEAFNNKRTEVAKSHRLYTPRLITGRSGLSEKYKTSSTNVSESYSKVTATGDGSFARIRARNEVTPELFELRKELEVDVETVDTDNEDEQPVPVIILKKVGLGYKLGVWQFFNVAGWLMFLLVLTSVLVIVNSVYPELFTTVSDFLRGLLQSEPKLNEL